MQKLAMMEREKGQGRSVRVGPRPGGIETTYQQRAEAPILLLGTCVEDSS